MALGRRKGPVVILWASRPALVIGRSLGYCEEVDCAAARSAGVPVVRRHTGGGAVFHDEGNLVFSVTTPAGRRLAVDEVYRWGTGFILEALGRLGVRAWVENEGDVVVDGWKVAGSAARSGRGAALYHAVVLVWSDMRLAELLRPPLWRVEEGLVTPAKYRPRPLSSLAGLSYSDVECSLLGVAEDVLHGLDECVVDEAEEEAASILYRVKYASPRWHVEGRDPEARGALRVLRGTR